MTSSYYPHNQKYQSAANGNPKNKFKQMRVINIPYSSDLYPEEVLRQSYAPSIVEEESKRKGKPTRRATRINIVLKDPNALLQEPFELNPYFKNFIRGIEPETQLEALLEEEAEKYCRSVLHIAANYLDRAAEGLEAQTPSSKSKEYDYLYAPEEISKMNRVSYATSRRRLSNLQKRLMDQGIDIRGQIVGDCALNYNFQNIPTNELYALFFMRAQNISNQKWLSLSELPFYRKDDDYLLSIRPFLMQRLQEWQSAKEEANEENPENTRQPIHYRQFLEC